MATIATIVALVSLSLIGYLLGWRPGTGQSPAVVGLVVAFSIAGVTLAVIGYRKRWTGFGDKTLWHWLELLIVPAVLGVGALLFTAAQDARQQAEEKAQNNRQQKAEESRAEVQQAVEENRVQDEALRAYIEEMGNLFPDENSRTTQEEGRDSLARAHTLTTLSRIESGRALASREERRSGRVSIRPDIEVGQVSRRSSDKSAARKRSIVQFLYESNLIQKDQPLVDLDGADLQEVDLSGLTLSGADLSGTNLLRANLERADLSGADLRDAQLSFAALTGTCLGEANLSSAHLFHADLTNAYLYDSDLSATSLSEAILSGTQLAGAYLASARRLTQEQIDAARGDGTTQLPDELQRPSWRSHEDRRDCPRARFDRDPEAVQDPISPP